MVLLTGEKIAEGLDGYEYVSSLNSFVEEDTLVDLGILDEADRLFAEESGRLSDFGIEVGEYEEIFVFEDDIVEEMTEWDYFDLVFRHFLKVKSREVEGLGILFDHSFVTNLLLKLGVDIDDDVRSKWSSYISLMERINLCLNGDRDDWKASFPGFYNVAESIAMYFYLKNERDLLKRKILSELEKGDSILSYEEGEILSEIELVNPAQKMLDSMIASTSKGILSVVEYSIDEHDSFLDSIVDECYGAIFAYIEKFLKAPHYDVNLLSAIGLIEHEVVTFVEENEEDNRNLMIKVLDRLVRDIDSCKYKNDNGVLKIRDLLVDFFPRYKALVLNKFDLCEKMVDENKAIDPHHLTIRNNRGSNIKEWRKIITHLNGEIQNAGASTHATFSIPFRNFCLVKPLGSSFVSSQKDMPVSIFLKKLIEFANINGNKFVYGDYLDLKDAMSVVGIELDYCEK